MRRREISPLAILHDRSHPVLNANVVMGREMDWSNCPDVERKPGVVSGARVVKGTRVPADAVVDNANDGFTAEAIVTEIYDSLPLEATRRVIAFARRHVAHSV